MKPRVLHYTGAQRDQGGVLSVLRELAASDDVAAIIGVSDGFLQTRRPRLRVWRGPPLESDHLRLSTLLQTVRVAWRLRSWMDGGSRIFHGHSRAGMWVAVWLALAGFRQVVVSVHCYGRRRWLYRWCAAILGDRLYWLTPAMREYYTGRGDADWGRCIPPPIRVTPNLALSARKRPAHRIHIGGVGLLVEWKRWDLMLEALRLLPAEERGDFVFSHIGGEDGSEASQQYAAQLRQRTNDLGLADTVTWRGVQASSSPLLSEIDVLVVLSTAEPCSVAMLEALAADVPVLAASSGGARDVITAGRHGWFFEDGSAVALADRLRQLRRPERWERLAPAEAVRRFESGRVRREWSAVYRELIEPLAPVI